MRLESGGQKIEMNKIEKHQKKKNREEISRKCRVHFVFTELSLGRKRYYFIFTVVRTLLCDCKHTEFNNG